MQQWRMILLTLMPVQYQMIAAAAVDTDQLNPCLYLLYLKVPKVDYSTLNVINAYFDQD